MDNFTRSLKWRCSTFIFGGLVALTLQTFIFSPISPNPLLFPSTSSQFYPTYNHLQNVTKFGQGLLKDPEDVCVDKEGVFYTATRDGWIKRLPVADPEIFVRVRQWRLHENGTWEDWKHIGGDTLLGITTTVSGHLLVCDSEKGLLKVGEDGVFTLASQVNGSDIRFADDAIEASDGNVYFSVASTKFGLHEWYLDVLEAKPHGQLLKYDPSSNTTSILLDDLCFANGVALSMEQDYLIVCETWKFRCIKYWLQGDKRGKSETFIENLPGAPDNINLAPDGSYWIALLQISCKGTEFVHSSKLLKHLIATFPRLIKWINCINEKATVINVSSDGKITRKYEDPTGAVMSFVTSAIEHEGHLYLGSLNSNFIGKLELDKLTE